MSCDSSSAAGPGNAATHAGQMGFLLFSLATVLFLSSFPDVSSWVRMVQRVLLLMILLTALFRTGHRLLFFAAVVPAVVNLSGGFAGLDMSSGFGYVTGRLTMFLVLALVITGLVKYFLRPDRVCWNKVASALIVYLLLGFAWAFAYEFVDTLCPGAFCMENVLTAEGEAHWPDFFYFSFVTLLTLGYGDITPVNTVARSLAMLEALTGTFFVATFIARVVSRLDVEKQ